MGNVIWLDVMNDEESIYIGKFRQTKVLPAIAHKTIAILSESNATREKLSDVSNISDTLFITCSGHGTRDKVPAFNGLDLFNRFDSNLEELVNEKIIHLHACWTGKKLGGKIVEKGCKAFFGYDSLFSFPIEDDTDLFELFMEPDKNLIDEVVEGKKAFEVTDFVIHTYNKNLSIIHNHTSYGNYFGLMETNKQSFCSPTKNSKYGDPMASLGEYV